MIDKMHYIFIIVAIQKKYNKKYDRMLRKMKKIVSVLLLLAVLLCMAPAVSAAGSASWDGPSVVRAGDSITLTFYAGGGIYGGSGTISYDSEVLTLQSYKQTIGGSWVVEFVGNNFVFYDNSMESPISGSSSIFRATFTVNSSVQTGAAVTVKASGVTLSDREQDIGIGTVSYSKTVAEPLSDNCNLRSLTVSGASISPAFSPDTTSYRANVPFSVSSIDVKAAAEDDGAKVSVSNPQLTAGSTTTVRITVTAENGNTKTYSIAVAREQDPNYVESSNANLSSLAAEGYVLSPVFSPDVTQYYVWLPYEAETITLSAGAEDRKAKYEIGAYDELLPGKGTDIAVTVTAEDGSQKVYTVTAVRAPSHDQTKQYLTGEREPEPTEPEPTESETQPMPTETQPAAAEPQMQQPQPAPGYGVEALVLTAVLGAAAGAGLLTLIMTLIRKKRKV